MATRAQLIVHFDDGRSESFNPNRPRLLLDLEKKYDVQAPETHAQISWLAWHALEEPKGDEGMSLNAWLDTVDEFETKVTEDDEESGKGDS